MVEQGMEDFIMALKPGMEVLRRITVGRQIIPVSFRCSKFSIEEREVSLISFQNIKTQLEDNELEAWQKIIRVLTHEIMNSVAPLSSLSSTLSWRYNNPSVLPVSHDESLFEDTRNALRIIESRSRGLIDFVGNYRKLTGIPSLNVSTIKVDELFHDVNLLMKEEAEEHGVVISIDISDPTLPLKADKKLVEQILINLLKNAVQCCSFFYCSILLFLLRCLARNSISGESPFLPPVAIIQCRNLFQIHDSLRNSSRRGTGYSQMNTVSSGSL